MLPAFHVPGARIIVEIQIWPPRGHLIAKRLPLLQLSVLHFGGASTCTIRNPSRKRRYTKLGCWIHTYMLRPTEVAVIYDGVTRFDLPVFTDEPSLRFDAWEIETVSQILPRPYTGQMATMDQSSILFGFAISFSIVVTHR
jgi:hypothetical protein